MTMEPLLYLVHRIPFPPNKGDKIRSYHLLRHLAQRFEVHLGTFIDDPADRAHLPRLSTWCSAVEAVDIAPAMARLRSLTGLVRGQALTLPYYRAPSLRRWVERTVKSRGIRRCVVFSSAMAQFIDRLPELRVIVDFCDVDSAKWTQYAAAQRWPLSSIYRREGQRLLAYERELAARSAASVFATSAEARLFERLSPASSRRVHVIENGVDSEYFRPDAACPTPYGASEEAVVFTGAMNYWPNADAACWFAAEVLPQLIQRRPAARFYVVGMNPTPTVAALARDPRIVVTGRVSDVRPYVQHAKLVVAPLRVARGIQNKVLEAMSMARPVLVSTACAEGLTGVAGVDFAVADGADQFAERAAALLAQPSAEVMGRRARERVVTERDWNRMLSAFDALLQPSVPTRPPAIVDKQAVHAR